MANIYIINAHHEYSFSPGKLNATLVEKAVDQLTAKEYEVKTLKVDDGYDVEQELSMHQWADVVILQTPVNWMGVT